MLLRAQFHNCGQSLYKDLFPVVSFVCMVTVLSIALTGFLLLHVVVGGGLKRPDQEKRGCKLLGGRLCYHRNCLVIVFDLILRGGED